MNTDSIKNRFAQVFENDYQGYDYFIENVVNPIFTGDDAYEPLPVPEEFLTDEKRQRANESGILSILKVGTVDAEEPVDLYDITLSDRKELQYNRVGIQQFIRSELFSFTNAFMLFHNKTPEGKDWRFSYAYKETTQKSMTSAKRYTYLFGKNHRARTASERFAKLAGEDKNTQNLLNAFSVEALSKDFFNEYKNQYNLFCKFISEHKNNLEFFGSKMAYWEDKSLRDYVKKMMGRITFIYFLQRKGWINGDMQYMQNAFQKSPHQDDYLDMFLEPLFFGVLNTKQKDRKTLFEKEGWDLSLLKEWKDVPYLNGGLFERDEHDQPKSKFPAEMFKNLFDFYARYNFTIDENDPDDAEVGVDPEMLGHIFENLLEDNKDKGAFYTPKEIVQYMCRESLIAYLTNCAEENTGHKYPHEQTEAHVRTLVQTPEQIVPKMSHRQKEDFGKALREVKICDPAIGSGAFPMGLLNELVRLRIAIGAWADKANDIAALKREIIQNNIYGVDIEKGAVDIARLRFWLSLVVDEIEPEPLPNLDYKIMCGNSLIHRFALDVSFKDVFSDYNKQHKTKYTLEDYKKWVADYLNTTDHTKKEDFRKKIEEVKSSFRSELTKKEVSKEQKLKKKINDIETANLFGLDQEQKKQILELKKQLNDLEKKHQDIVNNVVYENAFEWRFEFPALLDDDGNFTGFDIVIGNPPYINVENLDEKTKDYLFTHYFTCQGRTDIYIGFIEKAISLLNNKGMTSFIIPYSYTNQNYGELSRKMLAEKHSICEIVDTSNYYVFENAVVKNIIIRFGKSKGDYTLIRIAENRECFEKANFGDRKLQTRSFLQLKNCRIETKPFENILGIKEDIEKVSIRLGKLYLVAYGVRVNNKFDKSKPKSHYIYDVPQSHYKKFTEGKCIDRYSFGQFGWLNYCPDEHYNPMFPELFENEKLMFINVVSKGLRFAYDNEGFYNSHTVVNCVNLSKLTKSNHTTAQKAIKEGDVVLARNYSTKYVLGVINSKLINWYFMQFQSEGLHCYPDDAKQFPIAKASIEQQKPIIDLVDLILEKKRVNPNADTTSLESEIDHLVYQLYGLTEEEIKVVEGK